MTHSESILVFENVLDEADFLRLAAIAFTVRDLHRYDSTVWLRHDQAPRCFVEQVVEALRPWAPPGTSGGEWWFHMQPTTDELRLHFEKDDAMTREQGVFRQPERSFILYLTDCGGSTIFTDQSYISPTQVHPVDPTQYALVPPQHNRLVSFDSKLYHGVLNQDGPPALRQSFLINWWRTPPTAPDCTQEVDGISSAQPPLSAERVRVRVVAPRPVSFKQL